MEDFPDDKWEFLLNVNLTSNFYTIKEALPRMKQAGYGRIINISSAHGKVASVGKVRFASASLHDALRVCPYERGRERAEGLLLCSLHMLRRSTACWV